MEFYPTTWKTSLIVPLLKKPQPSSTSDIRPITNICHCAKPFDSIMSQQLSKYFETNRLLSPNQSGCRPGYSTHTALLKLTNDVRLAMNRDQVTILLLYDFSKAFNSIDHFMLLQILRLAGFDDVSIRFLFKYISDRMMYTPGSSVVPSTCGVGQGSGPGGLLFLIAINSLILVFMFAAALFFVDDTQALLHTSVYNVNDTILKINADSAGRMVSAARVPIKCH